MDNSSDNERDEQTAQPTIDMTDIEAYYHRFDEISSARQQELSERFWSWTPNKTSIRPGPFEGERLDGLEVLWLIDQAHQRVDKLTDAHPESVPWEHFPLPLMGVDLIDADLKGCHLRDACLEQAKLGRADLEGAVLVGARLAGANLRDARLEKASLEGADLTWAVLADTHLEGADLSGTRLIGADLSGAHLEGADLSAANLKGSDLSAASLDKMTRLNGVLLTDASLDQVLLDNTNLTVVDWDQVRVIGEEITANEEKGGIADTDVILAWDYNPFDPPNVVKTLQPDLKDHPKPRATRAKEYAAASRTYRLLVNALRGQGLTSAADHFDYRSQVMRRKQFLYQQNWGWYLWLGFLSIVAGYGYRLSRVFRTYAVVVAFFAVGFLLTGLLTSHTSFTWQAVFDAVQISLNAIHGRVFFAQFNLDTLQSWLATIESLCGIVVEGVFVAVLIQKLFSR